MLKNITLSADENMIQQARAKAIKNKQTLNALFREWLKNYIKNETSISDYSLLMSKLKHVNSGKHFSRDEYNER